MIIGQSIVEEACIEIGNLTIQTSQMQTILDVLIDTNQCVT